MLKKKSKRSQSETKHKGMKKRKKKNDAYSGEDEILTVKKKNTNNSSDWIMNKSAESIESNIDGD